MHGASKRVSATPTGAPDPDTPPKPTRRVPTVALLIGSAAFIAAVLLADTYAQLPTEVTEALTPVGPPAELLIACTVFLEGLAATYLVASSRHPLDVPFITHYGTRTLAAGGTAVGAGVVGFLVWATARDFLPIDAGLWVDTSIGVILVGSSLLLSAIAVMACAIVAPWLDRNMAEADPDARGGP